MRDEDLLELLIEGIAEDPPWSTFVDGLRQRIRADYASIVFRPLPFGSPQHNRVIHLASGRESPPIIAQLYRDTLYRTDPMPYDELGEGKVYALPELLRIGDPDHDSYRRQLLEPSGMNFLRMLRVAEPGGVSAWITVSRGAGDFRPADDQVLAFLLELDERRKRALQLALGALEPNAGRIERALDALEEGNRTLAHARLALHFLCGLSHHQTSQSNSPPTRSRRASLSVMTPREVERMAMPRPFMTLGRSSWPT